VLAGAYYVPMGRPSDKALSPTPHYYEIRGRGSQIGGAEHLFLGMLHDGGWPVNVISPFAADERSWIRVTREVLNHALARLGRPSAR
jgi:hypothetical protein